MLRKLSSNVVNRSSVGDSTSLHSNFEICISIDLFSVYIRCVSQSQLLHQFSFHASILVLQCYHPLSTVTTISFVLTIAVTQALSSLSYSPSHTNTDRGQESKVGLDVSSEEEVAERIKSLIEAK